MEVTRDNQADAVYVRFSRHRVARTLPVQGNRSGASLNLDKAGAIVGVEFLGTGAGIDLTNLPEATEIREALEATGLKIASADGEARDKADRFLRIIGEAFMAHDIQAAIDGKANFLAALGLLTYTEILGGIILGKLDARPKEKFNAFVPYLGRAYQAADQRAIDAGQKGLWSFRNVMVHSYGLKVEGSIRMQCSGEGHAGLEYSEAAGWDFCVDRYLKDFLAAIATLRAGVREDPKLADCFQKALGAALNI
jgi:hypothetical protein